MRGEGWWGASMHGRRLGTRRPAVDSKDAGEPTGEARVVQ
jgi:hypothetical protein